MAEAVAISAKPLAKPEAHALPVAVICAVIFGAWYIAAIPMNWVITGPKIEAAGGGFSNILAFSWNDQRPSFPPRTRLLWSCGTRCSWWHPGR